MVRYVIGILASVEAIIPGGGGEGWGHSLSSAAKQGRQGLLFSVLQDVFFEWKTLKGLLLLYRDSLCKQLDNVCSKNFIISVCETE